MNFNHRFQKSVSAALCAALLLLSPGPGAYAALRNSAGKNHSAAPAPAGVPAQALGLTAVNASGAFGNLLPVPGLSVNAAPSAPQVSPIVGSPASASPASLPSEEAAKRPAALSRWLSSARETLLPKQAVASMPAGDAHQFGASLMDGLHPARPGAEPVFAAGMGGRSRLEAAPAGPGIGVPGDIPPASIQLDGPDGAPRPRAGKALLLLRALGRMAGAAGAVAGLHVGAAALLPAVFGMVPAAALWSVGSGILLLPVALYARYRLSLRDSARLSPVKTSLDLFIGAFLGAVGILVPSALSGELLTSLALLGGVALPIAGATAMGLGAERFGAAGRVVSGILAITTMSALAPLFGSAAALPLTLGGVFGLLSLPAMTTVAFFLGRIIFAAESGKLFQAASIRFPSYTWVMTGVVFALLTGYSAVWSNYAIMFWTFFGSTPLFNRVFVAVAGWAAATGFGAPVTFLALAFAPERAANWTERLLSRLLKPGAPAPSTKAKPVQLAEDAPERWPRFYFWLRTGLLLGSLAALGFTGAALIFGWSAYFTNFLAAAALTAIPTIFSRQLIKITMKATPMDPVKDAEVIAIMSELREIINAQRAAKGQKPIPMPEMVNVPMGVPNAFATGISPFRAMVGVSDEIRAMTLDPETLRRGVIRLMGVSDPSEKSFLVFRKAVRESIPGIPEDAGPQEIALLVAKADAAQLKDLGRRTLRGVLAHEFSHVMHRDMILGAVAGTLSSIVAFGCYGVLWAVSHAENLAGALKKRLFGGRAEKSGAPNSESAAQGERQGEGAQPEMAGPAAAAAAAKLLALAVNLAAIWAPIMGTILQMAASRTREGHADEGGALLGREPAFLALGLGLLTTWAPPPGFKLERKKLPMIASQAHVMTVNPIDQLRQAGALPAETEGLTRLVVGPQDDFFFNLFITHPNTTLRIERLHDMSLATPPSRDGGEASQGPASGSPYSMRASAPGAAPESVDPNSAEGYSVPGLDERLAPVLGAFQSEVESSAGKRAKLGHQLWATQKFLDDGGIIRYANLQQSNGEQPPFIYNAAAKALYVNNMLLRLHPRIQAGFLADPLQRIYDSFKERAEGTREALMRQALAQEAFFDGVDLAALSDLVDLNNAVEYEIYERLLEGRTWATSTIDQLERHFDASPTVDQLELHLLHRLRLLDAKLGEEKRRLGAVNRRLQAAPGDQDLEKRKRVAAERIESTRAELLLAEASLRRVEKEVARSRKSEPALGFQFVPDTRLSVDGETGSLELGRLPVVLMKKPLQVDPRVERSLAMLRRSIEGAPDAEMLALGYSLRPDPGVKKLSYLVEALDKLLASGGRVVFAPTSEGALAYFDPISLDLVLGLQFINAHPRQQVALLGHELAHAADYFAGKALTRETERHAFIVTAVLGGAWDSQKVAAQMDPANEMDQVAMEFVDHARDKYSQGHTSLGAMICKAYTKLFGTHFDGLPFARHLSDEIKAAKLNLKLEERESYRRQAEDAARDVRDGVSQQGHLESLRRFLAVYDAYIRLYERHVTQLEAAAQETEKLQTAGKRPWSLASFLGQ